MTRLTFFDTLFPMSRMSKALDQRERELSRAISSARDIRVQRERLDRQEADLVRLLRSEGISWRSIGDLFGKSHEAMRRQYGALKKWGAG